MSLNICFSRVLSVYPYFPDPNKKAKEEGWMNTKSLIMLRIFHWPDEKFEFYFSKSCKTALYVGKLKNHAKCLILHSLYLLPWCICIRELLLTAIPTLIYYSRFL